MASQGTRERTQVVMRLNQTQGCLCLSERISAWFVCQGPELNISHCDPREELLKNGLRTHHLLLFLLRHSLLLLLCFWEPASVFLQKFSHEPNESEVK